MIRSFRYRGLELLHERDDPSRIHAAYRTKISRILSYLDQARKPSDMDFPGLRLHPRFLERFCFRQLADRLSL